MIPAKALDRGIDRRRMRLPRLMCIRSACSRSAASRTEPGSRKEGTLVCVAIGHRPDTQNESVTEAMMEVAKCQGKRLESSGRGFRPPVHSRSGKEIDAVPACEEENWTLFV